MDTVLSVDHHLIARISLDDFHGICRTVGIGITFSKKTNKDDQEGNRDDIL